uniref:Uncharacterized protein n=1 Tax=Syphacia muris TaxID=451379 RepID=A0A0N5AIW2_9BILA
MRPEPSESFVSSVRHQLSLRCPSSSTLPLCTAIGIKQFTNDSSENKSKRIDDERQFVIISFSYANTRGPSVLVGHMS